MKNVIILEEAARDLKVAFDFYEKMETGTGSYVAKNLLSEIEILTDTSGIHHLAIIGSLLKNFQMLSTTK